MSAVPDALNRLTINIHKLRTAIDECDCARRLPAVIPEPLKALAEEECMNSEAVDLDIALSLMNQAARVCYVRADRIRRLTREIEKAKAATPPQKGIEKL